MYRVKFIPLYIINDYNNSFTITNNELEYIYKNELEKGKYSIYELPKSEYPQYYV
jgi:hypothetical protein